MRETILRELDRIEAEHDVRILYAAESGSRAWGFASPDSDYDVRFVYVRKAFEYVRLDEPRDGIEHVNDGLLDINGWDLKKAMGQFARGNATLFEWSGSPHCVQNNGYLETGFPACDGIFLGKKRSLSLLWDGKKNVG